MEPLHNPRITRLYETRQVLELAPRIAGDRGIAEAGEPCRWRGDSCVVGMQPTNSQRIPAPVPLLLAVASLLACGSSADLRPVDGAIDGAPIAVKGTNQRPVLDPRAIGTSDLSRVTVAAFSQTAVSRQDPQVLSLQPDLVPRAWGQWDREGLKVTDYASAYAAACQANRTLFVGGLTASVIFTDQMSDGDFADEVGRDASGQPVPHSEVVPNAYRGSLASPGFRQRIVDIAKLQIDAGVDGVFFDEANASYSGARYDGNEGFDDHHVADFGRFLCTRYGGDATALAGFGLAASDRLDCSAVDPGASFDYRGYLARQGFQNSPLSPANRLAALWGTTVPNRPDPSEGGFVETYSMLVYWQEIVVAVRTYARERYGKEVLITSNGVFPFVDFQSIGLYDWNKDGPGPRGVDYVPTVGTSPNIHFNGTVSLMPILAALKARSKRIVEAAGGHEVPILLFLDWPADAMNRYYAFSKEERQDYVRMFVAEASAFGMWFAFPLATTTDQNTATALGMMELFQGLRDFYRARREVVSAGRDLAVTPELSATNVAAHVVGFDDKTVVHLVNHNYNAGFTRLSNLSVTLPLAQAPNRVTLVSADQPQDQPAPFSYADGKVTVTVDALVSSAMLVLQ